MLNIILISAAVISVIAAYKFGEFREWNRLESRRKSEADKRAYTYQIDKIVFADNSEKFQVFYINGLDKKTPLLTDGYFNTQEEAQSRIKEKMSLIVINRETIFRTKKIQL